MTRSPVARHQAQSDLSPAQLEADEIDLYTGLRGVAGLVAGARGVIDLLGDVAEFAAQAIPGVDGVGVALIQSHDGTPRIQTWAATAELVHDIDVIQYEELNEGPCITCMQLKRAIVSGSLGSDSRWPRFGGRVARMAIHSALSLPLMVGDEVIGAINTYARPRDAFGEHAVQLGTQFAGPAAVSVYNAQLLAGAQERTKAAAACSRQPGGDRSGDRHHSQPVGCQRGGGLRPAHPAEPDREHQAASSLPSGWWRRRRGEHLRGIALKVAGPRRIRRVPRSAPGGSADRS